jgi:hypothetical protein
MPRINSPRNTQVGGGLLCMTLFGAFPSMEPMALPKIRCAPLSGGIRHQIEGWLRTSPGLSV